MWDSAELLRDKSHTLHLVVWFYTGTSFHRSQCSKLRTAANSLPAAVICDELRAADCEQFVNAVGCVAKTSRVKLQQLADLYQIRRPSTYT